MNLYVVEYSFIKNSIVKYYPKSSSELDDFYISKIEWDRYIFLEFDKGVILDINFNFKNFAKQMFKEFAEQIKIIESRERKLNELI